MPKKKPIYPLYGKWLQHVFDRSVTRFGDHLDDDGVFDATPAEVVQLIGQTCEHSYTDLDKFSDAQVNQGLCYIFFNSASDVVSSLLNKDVDEKLRFETIKKMKILYRDCLTKRCDPVLSHKNEPSDNPLQYFCYMLWDLSPLGCWKEPVLDVMESALYMSNPACIESGLHGLGHYRGQNPKKVEAIIDKFLAAGKWTNPDLKLYATYARRGMVQ